MKNITYITGNQKKADYLASYLEHPIEHLKVDLDEIQSLDLLEIVTHKVRQAYSRVGKPVLVEDTSLEFHAFGKLPGPFIRYFMEQMSVEDICSLLKDKDRGAMARCMFGYYDGEEEEAYFEGSINGTIAEIPEGDDGFGWNNIFIPEGYNSTMAELNTEDYKKVYMTIKPIKEVRDFLNK